MSDGTWSGSKYIARVAAAVAVAPALYALSIGPMLLLVAKASPRPAIFYRACLFYRPVIRVAAKTEMSRALADYLRWWGIRSGTVAGKVGTAQHGTIVPVQPDFR
jgi:hypothetical protein